MTASASTCPQCQAPVSAGTRFCGSCGATIEQKPAAAPMAKTMMGMDAASVLAAAEKAKGLAAERAQTDAAALAVAPTLSDAKPMAKTMMGLPLGEMLAKPPAAEPAPAAPAPAPDKKAFAARTMLGMPLSAADIPKAAAPADKPAPAAAPAMDNKRTMIGGAGFVLPSAANAAPATEGKPSGRPPKGAAGGGRTMLGVPLTSAHDEADDATASDTGSAADFDSFARSPGSEFPEPMSARRTETDTLSIRGGRSRFMWLFVVAAVVVIAVVAGLLLRGRSSSTQVSARVMRIDTGDALLLEVPGAPVGAKIRFGGQEKPLQAGRAQFALATESLRVGDNIVQFDIVQPDGSTESTKLTLAVDHRIWLDTAPLRADKSAVDVVVATVPGTKVTLDGEELKLDAEGRGTRTYPVDPVADAKGGKIEHVVQYRVQPPSGEPVADELRTTIPVATMQIDRPGREVVTDRASIEIGGVVPKGTQVTVDGVAVEVNADQRFLYRLSLPAAQTYKPRVVASAPGKVPMGVTLDIRRVADLTHAAREFIADPDLTYAKLAPNPSIYRGQKIAIEGRVYAASAQGGASYFQILARPCPSSQRCAMWINDPSATEVHEDDWVRVLGIAEGEQQFRSQKNDEIVSVPKVEARFVLPAKP
jgi:hypothetical protein